MAVKGVLDNVDEALFQSVLAGPPTEESSARLKAEIGGEVERLKGVGQGDAELAKALDDLAADIVNSVELLESEDFLERAGELALGFGEAQDVVDGLCGKYWRLALSAEGQATLAAVCQKIDAVDAADGVAAERLWVSLRDGGVPAERDQETRAELARTWTRIAEAYRAAEDSVPADEFETVELRDFGRVKMQAAMGYHRAATAIVKPDGVAEVEKIFGERMVAGYQRRLANYCP